MGRDVFGHSAVLGAVPTSLRGPWSPGSCSPALYHTQPHPSVLTQHHHTQPHSSVLPVSRYL